MAYIFYVHMYIYHCTTRLRICTTHKTPVEEIICPQTLSPRNKMVQREKERRYIYNVISHHHHSGVTGCCCCDDIISIAKMRPVIVVCIVSVNAYLLLMITLC
eukprot:GHVS01074566.1.p1 GENE.GHVS01074566.1~~GHVS01074566.1.p1  ORF type:complete len:103 (-),score=5.63 GHVS01074566.1:59-367(-)